MTSSFKIGLVGSAGVGKTAFVRRHTTSEFESAQVDEFGPICFPTTAGRIEFNMVDDIRSVDGVIVMYDVTSKDTYTEAIKIAATIDPNIPTIMCGNKVDASRDRKVKTREASKFFHTQPHNIDEWYEISVKSNYNYEKPLISLTRLIFKNDQINLKFE